MGPWMSYQGLTRAFWTSCINNLQWRTLQVVAVHWPGAVTRRLVSRLFAKATQKYSMAQRLVAPCSEQHGGEISRFGRFGSSRLHLGTYPYYY